jgi:hypothetical protein
VNTYGAYCSTDIRTSLQRSTKYLWNNGVYAGKYQLYHWMYPRVCADGDEWDPIDPATQNTDPLLP